MGLRNLNISFTVDAALAVGVAGAVALLVFPLPTPLIDGLLAAQLGLAVVVLLAALGVRHPLELSAFPAILLLTTLFRLALNVSTTRLILSQGDAGQVVAAFGDAVVSGNFLVGAVVFGVLTIVQYLVIAKGAERVAQVGARFALDGLPGRQLAIDADVRAGLVDPETARQRRAALARESGLFGAMDGAMKFVRGDAIAGLCIVGINVVGGLAIGVGQLGLPLEEAVGIYTVLTVGDGLVAQLPALLTSIAAAFVVTRVASPDSPDLAHDTASQLSARAAPLWIGAMLLGVLAILPGLPGIPLAGIGVLLVAVAVMRRPSGRAAPRSRARARQVEATGVSVHPSLDPSAAVAQARAELQTAHGLDVPVPAIHVDADLPAGGYLIAIGEAPVARGTSHLGDALAAAWRRHVDALLGIQMVADRLAAIEAEVPALIRAVVPRRLDLPQLTRHLRALVREDVPSRNLLAILEILAQVDASASEAEQLAALRRGLAPQLTARLAPLGELTALFPSPTLEAALRGPNGLGPEEADAALDSLNDALALSPDAVLMMPADIRVAARDWLADEHPALAVVSAEELLPHTRTKVGGLVGLG